MIILAYRNYYIINNLLSTYDLIFASSNESDSFKRISDMFGDRIKWYTPAEFNQLADIGREIGFKHVVSGPLVRSSYHADEQHAALNVDVKDLAPV